jgi:outer membrane receptor protein involved in Fe transport
MKHESVSWAVRQLCRDARREAGHGVRLFGLGSGILALSLVGEARAQSPTPGETAIEEVSVTASRIAVSGFEAPTPITVVSREDIDNIGATNIAEALNQMPAFFAGSTPTTSSLNSTTNGSNFVNLRAMGTGRTLVLVDGHRHVATTNTGTVDLNVIPSAAVARVDVVTGGASAAWGSDAVAGVVNIRLDDQLQGMRSTVQYGQSTHGDGEDSLVSVAAGDRFADGRGHFIIAAEYNKNEGVMHQRDRDWGRAAWAWLGQPGTPSNIIAPNVNIALGTEGGLILGPGPIANIQFGPGGTLLPYQRGSIVSGALQVGGDGANMGQYRVISVPYDRKNILTHVDYALNDYVTAYFDGSFAESHAISPTVQTFDFGITIRADNAFIPAALRTLMTNNSLTSFSLGRVNTDLGFVTADTKNQTTRAAFGFKGKFGESWSWDAYFQHGETSIDNLQLNNRIAANFANAVDAVVNPANGQIVCRATLSGRAPGCVPLNLFGFGSPSAAAIAYVNGTGFLYTTIEQEVAAASLSGKLFELPAGAVTGAAGVEYRKEESRSSADPIAVAGGYSLIGNTTPIGGDFDVKEGFVELNVPILAQLPGADLLDINGAVRETDYSLSGSVRTWKAGFNYKPFGDLRLRGTRSRDIRAPNVSELFTTNSITFTSVLDARTGTVNPLVKIVGGGNVNLRPEIADTKTVGIVYEPSQAEGLRLSVDYYDIRIEDAISTLGAQSLVTTCELGAANACAAITRDPATGQLVQINTTNLNIAEVHTEGVDIEALYATDVLQRFGFEGQLTFRLLANRMEHLESSPDGIVFRDSIGVVGPNFGSTPHWRGNFSATYARGPFSVFGQARYVGGGKFNGDWTEQQIADNSIPSVTYFDLSMRYVFDHAGNRFEFFAGANNVLDKSPPISPINFVVPISTNVSMYDLVGRFVFGGVRLKF